MSFPDPTAAISLLLVDDDAIDRMAARRALHGSDLRATLVEAENAAEAQEALANASFDCILLDFQLPGTDGLEVLRTLRSAGVRTPVIMLTGQTDAQVAVNLMKAGATDYLTKDQLSPQSLGTIVRSALRIHRAESIAARAETQRQEAESALRHSEHLLVTTLRSIGDAVVATDDQGCITFMNSTAEQLTGWRAAEAVGEPLDGIIPLIDPSTGEVMAGLATHVLRSGAVIETVDGALMEDSSGRCFPITGSGAPIKDANGSVMGVVVVLRDITERVRTEERLRILAELSQALATSLDEREHLTSLASLAVPRLADLCAVDMIGPEGLMERVAQVASEGLELEVGDGRRPPRHGETATLRVPLVVRDEERGAITMVRYGGDPYQPDDVRFAEELSRRAAMAIDNALLYREAQEAIHIRDAFLSVASHELKTPLTSLLGFLDLLQRRVTPGTVVGEREQRRIEVAQQQAHRLHKMVASLLDLSRLQTGQLSIERNLVDLGALLRRIGEETMPTLPHNHQLIVDTPGEPLIVVGDDLRLEQVIHNLLQNAVKYSPLGGPIIARADINAGEARLQVRDHGMGIPQEAHNLIFSRFYRATNTAAQNVSGMGVGLYVVKQIVELHGGRVEVESIEGEGSTFTIMLPLAPHSPLGVAAGEEDVESAW